MLGTEPDFSEIPITLPVPRADANYIVLVNCQGVASIVAADITSKTNVDFILITTGNLQGADVLAFVIVSL